MISLILYNFKKYILIFLDELFCLKCYKANLQIFIPASNYEPLDTIKNQL